MKKTIITITFSIISFFCNAQATVYHPFPTDSAVWTDVRIGINMTYYLAGNFIWGLTGDTVINGNSYGKLFINSVQYGNEDTAFNPMTATYLAALREDSVKKVWIIFSTDSIEYVYYDFSLNVGDTFYFPPPPLGFGDIGIVTSIDSMLILPENSYRKKFEILRNIGMETWIEGIGNTCRWFEYQQLQTFGCEFSCFYLKGIHIFDQATKPFVGYTGCTVLLGIDENQSAKLVIISPNPAENRINYLLNNFTSTSATLTVFDAFGKPVLKEQITYFEGDIDISLLNNGVYLIQLDIGDKVARQKFVKNAH